MSRRWLIAVSVAAHAAIMVGVFVSGIWRLERLQAERPRIALHTQPPPPAPAGGAISPQRPAFERKHIAKETIQPTPRPVARPEPAPASGGSDAEGAGSGSGAATETGSCIDAHCGEPDRPPPAPVCGNGTLETGEQCDDGNTIGGDGCSTSCRLEIHETVVPPPLLQGLRLSGETQIHPSAVTEMQMRRDGADRVAGTIKVCVAASGRVASAGVLRSTNYAEYDAALVSSVLQWRYRPYTIQGIPTPACSTVTFVYTTR